MIPLTFVLNRDPVTIPVSPTMTVLDFLREERGLAGTKEACREGDCGACTVALGELSGGRVRYRAVNSCLLPVAKLHGRHLVTVEGLSDGDRLHPIQQVLVDAHAVQCGFCTPGIVMSLFCLLAENGAPTDEDLLAALEGNLCRCTGYEVVRRACIGLRGAARESIVPKWMDDAAARLPLVGPAANGPDYSWYAGPVAPSPAVRPIAGGTDLMVAVNEGRRAGSLVDLSRDGRLRAVKNADESVLVGGAVTLEEVMESSIVRDRLPALAFAVSRMASRQIRNVATLAGNVANASPVADAAVLLLALGAKLAIESRAGRRSAPLDGFYVGYKQTALHSGEIIAAIEIPAGWLASFEKTGKRNAVDIASVNSALVLRMDGAVISAARLALGGVAATPVLSRGAAELMHGRKPSLELAREAGALAAAEVSPISDVRGGVEFRRELVRNHVVLHFLRLFPELAK